MQTKKVAKLVNSSVIDDQFVHLNINILKNYCEPNILYARSICYQVLNQLWNIVDADKRFNIRKPTFLTKVLNFEQRRITKELAVYFSRFSVIDYSYYIGVVYTSLLPKDYKSKLGVYYTPPIIAERLLDILTVEGADWSQDTILDPACGGGAFLVPVVNRILSSYKIKELSPNGRLKHIEEHLNGIEIDPFAAWITQVLIDITIYDDCVSAKRQIKNIVTIEDTIQYAIKNSLRKFSVVVGNPPFGKVKLDPETRKLYARSLYGHANLYGLFIDSALRLKTEKGIIGFVTPTSFLGGNYFKNLRQLLSTYAPLKKIDFISSRTGIFSDVLQETCLAVFGDNQSKGVTIHNIKVDNNDYGIEHLGVVTIKHSHEAWILPRTAENIKIVKSINDIKTTLKDYGYKAVTGQLVWNRHKKQLYSNYVDGSYPILWSEAIKNERFSIDYRVRSDKKFIKLKENQDYLLCKKPVLLVQRTTAKEQNRRLIATVIPEEFFSDWKYAVVENHVNIINPENPKISLKALSYILNSDIVDQIFRCISGSVAVSVSELHMIPLPDPKLVNEIDTFITLNIDPILLKQKIEVILWNAYFSGGK